MYGYCGDSKLGLHQFDTTSSTDHMSEGVFSLPRVSCTIRRIPSISVSFTSSSPDGSLKNVVPEGLGPVVKVTHLRLTIQAVGTHMYLIVVTAREVGCVHEPTKLPPLTAASRISQNHHACAETASLQSCPSRTGGP